MASVFGGLFLAARLYNLTEFAQLVGVKPATLRKYKHEGLLPRGIPVGGGREAWTKKAIREWNERRKHKRGTPHPDLYKD
jgi:predicted DNA-binding transcriptional regulator AlpA